MDGTPEVPYRQPNHAVNCQEAGTQQIRQIQDFPDETHWDNLQNI
jgi:hypothetical protein